MDKKVAPKKGHASIKKMEIKRVVKSNDKKSGVSKSIPKSTPKARNTVNSSNTTNQKKVINNNSNVKKVVINKEAKEYRKPKKKNKKVIIISLIFAFIVLIGVLIYLLCTLSQFALVSINVTGNEKYSAQEIIDSSGLAINKNVFWQTFRVGNKNVLNLPYVEDAKLSVSFPNKINIKVKERVPTYFGFDKERNRFFRIDSMGYILEEADINSKGSNELLTFGISFDNEVVLGSKINDVDLSRIVTYVKIKEAFVNTGISGEVTKVNFENSLTTLTLNDKLNVVLPNDTNLKYNMVFLQSIIKELPEGSVGIIDMTKSKPVFSSF